MSDLDKIVRLVKDDNKERRIAAARVLGALKAKGASVVAALTAMLSGEDADERRAAAIALGEIRSAKTVGCWVDALLDPVAMVSAAAAEAVRALWRCGSQTVAKKARRHDRRSRAGALVDRTGLPRAAHRQRGALLDGLAGASEDAARSAALRFRQEIKTAPAPERKEHLRVIEAFLRGEPATGTVRKTAAKTAASKKKAQNRKRDQARR